MKIQFFLKSMATLALLSACSSQLPTPHVAMNPMMRAQLAPQSTRFVRANQQTQQRFVRSELGVISDKQTGLQWLEGPDVPTSWEMANEWVNTLGQGWRLPTTQELSAIYLKDSQRKGTYNDPLCLDDAFTRESGYSFWSVKRSSNSAWMYDFSRGYYHWTEVRVKGHFDRAVAVRKQQAQLELPF